MKTFIAGLVLALALIGGYFWWQGAHSASSVPTAEGGQAGAHCGGFIQNAPTCAVGLHCQLDVSHPDTGGTCVPDTTTP